MLNTLQPSAPLLVETPSGGMRILIRVPTTEVLTVLDWRTGAIARALRSAGLSIGTTGDVELYPQAKLGDRILVGVQMPELDPQTLTPIAEVPPAGDTVAFRQFISDRLARFDRMVAAPDAELITRAQVMVANQAWIAEPEDAAPATNDLAEPEGAAPAENDVRDMKGSQGIIARAQELLARGLTRPRSRNAAEWLIAVQLVIDPGSLARLGISAHDGSNRGIARALAEWLAIAANGYSSEWRKTFASVHGRIPDAIAIWERRYLRGASTGNSIIDRARRAAAAKRTTNAGGSWWAAQISDDDWRHVRGIGHNSALTGAAVFRFEVWATCFLLAARAVSNYRALRGAATRITRDGREWMRAPICTRWMAGWPGGSGTRGDASQLSYKCYLGIAIDQGLAKELDLSPATRSTRTALAVGGVYDGLPADEYLVLPTPPATETPYSAAELAAVAHGIGERDGRPVHPVEVLHLLRLQDANVNWRQAYGPSSGRRYRQAAQLARFLLLAYRTPAEEPELH